MLEAVPTDNTCSHENSFICQDASDMSPFEFVEFKFTTKELRIENLNIRHILPKIDDIRIVLSNEQGPALLGLCETFLCKNNPDAQLTTKDGFNFLRKDRSDVQDKSGGGLLFYYKQSLQVTRRNYLEISNIESIWAEVSLPNSRSCLSPTFYTCKLARFI